MYDPSIYTVSHQCHHGRRPENAEQAISFLNASCLPTIMSLKVPKNNSLQLFKDGYKVVLVTVNDDDDAYGARSIYQASTMP